MRTQLTTAALTAAALLTLAACSSDGDNNAPISTKPATAPPISAPAIPSPDAAQQATLLAQLGAIDPGLTTNTDRAIRRAVNSCETLHTTTDHKAAVHTIAMRFDGGNAHVDDAKAEKIAAAIQATFCK